MSKRIIKVLANKTHKKKLDTLAKECAPSNAWSDALTDTRLSYSFLVKSEEAQALIDKLTPVVGKDEKSHLLVLPVHASLAQDKEDSAEEGPESIRKSSVSREELYNDLHKSAELDLNFLLLVFFSTIVTSVGLLENNVAVVIGAMVIAPLLGPNLALAFATTLGDVSLMVKSLKTNVAGFAVTLTLATAIGCFWHGSLTSEELLTRTDVSFSSMTLALASGAAGALALTTGLSMVLVGVMVAVALLPPAATLGIFFGAGKFELATSAGLLLAVNIVCVNLSAKLVFLLKHITPRTWYQKKKARGPMRWYLATWIILLCILAGIIYLKGKHYF